jgi:hypothetical protein
LKGKIRVTDEEPRIIQIIPAQPGWQAVYAKIDKGYRTENIVCWALTAYPSGNTSVVAMTMMEADAMSMPVAETSLVSSAKSGFIGYHYPGCSTDWEHLAKVHREDAWDTEQELWKV